MKATSCSLSNIKILGPDSFKCLPSSCLIKKYFILYNIFQRTRNDCLVILWGVYKFYPHLDMDRVKRRQTQKFKNKY